MEAGADSQSLLIPSVDDGDIPGILQSTVRISSPSSSAGGHPSPGAGDFDETRTLQESGDWGSALKPDLESFHDVHTVSHSRSAPLLPAQHSQTVSTWYTGASLTSSPSKRTHWKPLGATWRDWDAKQARQGIQRDANNKRDFIHGVVPNWMKQGTLRIKSLLEHELAWSYYRTRRHEGHPLRDQVGERLDPKSVVGAMRSGGNIFSFWRDLRPPFDVLEVTRMDEKEEGSKPHPDGDLFRVTYECPIEYQAERLWGMKSDGGTFNNKVHGIAEVRIPLDFPEKSHLRVAGWGTPVVNWSPQDDRHMDPPVERPTAVDPWVWMPIADELELRPDMNRFKGCRQATRIASRRADAARKRGIQVPEMQKLLLGSHASLPRLAAAEQRLAVGSPPQTAGGQRAKSSAGPRKHCVFTASSGFVHYAG
eukprot:TRINITY_DN91869_c0_g1_i1.p1 TRINITY_DN91869_c0_g1~~TRINITY_DN91869_c0_g1_i1.p1  ORF type:complete len:423 (+),score=71.39 TRINITY_DN91869_c0_g1_i1:119-1387(+)